MQRFFVDFGTGTSIDSPYFVVSTESTIGSSGYKTDLKLSYSAGFATYVSLNQNLAMLSANFANVTGQTEENDTSKVIPPPPGAPKKGYTQYYDYTEKVWKSVKIE